MRRLPACNNEVAGLTGGIGARAYYMRNVLHDLHGTKCVQILHQIKSAMTEESVILIDEMVLPNEGTHWLAAALDLLVMSNFAATQRSEKQWQNLLHATGFKVKDVFTYTEKLRDNVIVAVPV